MRTILLIAALALATVSMPSAAATTDLNDINNCPPQTVDRVICIAEQAAGPVIDLAVDEINYWAGVVSDACNHSSSQCPLIATIVSSDHMLLA